MLIQRHAFSIVQSALSRQAAVALIGPRQVGKTTLARMIGEQQNALYLDLEDREDRDKLASPRLYLERFEDRLVILDEIHRMPELFQTLRGIIDEGRPKGKGVGRFLVLGSASIDLLRQSGESLAGRIAYVNLTPLTALEVDAQRPTPNARRSSDCGCAAAFRTPISLPMMLKVWHCGKTSSALISNATCRCSVPASRPKPWSGCGPCWRTIRGAC